MSSLAREESFLKKGETMEIRDFAKTVVSARPQDSLMAVARLMDEHNVGAVVILEKQRPVGMITDRDLALELGARRTSPDVPVSQVMSTPVATVPWTDNLVEVTESMRELNVRRLVVVDDDQRVTGIVTLDDLLQVLIGALDNLRHGIAPEMLVN